MRLLVRPPATSEFRGGCPWPSEDVGAYLLGYVAEIDADKLARLRSEG
jgi:hypothetical protein